MNQTDNIWTENIILADADYIDQVAFNLIVNFERMLGRRIPQADMARWTECIALDGRLREGNHQTTVVLLHEQNKIAMENFQPSHYAEELNAKAFKSQLGEFTFNAICGEGLVSKENLFIDTLQLLISQKEVKRLLIIPDDNYFNKVREVLNKTDDDDKRITVFSMQPMAGGMFRQEILGYSLMAALGIHSDELDQIK